MKGRGLRHIRTMRDLWARKAAQGQTDPETRDLAGSLVRIQTHSGTRAGPGGTRSGLPSPRAGEEAGARRVVRPWIFKKAPAGGPGRTLARVALLAEPTPQIAGSTEEELILLYSIAGLVPESVEIELQGDVLVLAARGRNLQERTPFEIHSEALLPWVPDGAKTSTRYAGEILEVRITAGGFPGTH